jgi:hypothetical protein
MLKIGIEKRHTFASQNRFIFSHNFLQLKVKSMHSLTSTETVFASISVDYYALLAKSTKAKHNSTAALIQKYIVGLQTRLGLPPLNYNYITEIGGSPSSNNDDITKWWYVFWDGKLDFWTSLRKANGTSYATGTLERYMPSIKNQLKKKFILSRYVKVIEETYTSAMSAFKTKLKAGKTAPPKNKVCTNDDTTFILQRCLWFNTEKYIDFFVFQTALLRLCSRATETSCLTLLNLSTREVNKGGSRNAILRCYVVRDKSGIDNNHPLIPNKSDVFGDLTVAVSLALFLRNDASLMPSIASLKGESAVALHLNA